ncbi:MAG: CPBP family intramembrane metalloprotease [Planctomycetes bacterium]|nr:CPBP family intramembrane metalloprotease [Planctomycetota bacterium]
MVALFALCFGLLAPLLAAAENPPAATGEKRMTQAEVRAEADAVLRRYWAAGLCGGVLAGATVVFATTRRPPRQVGWGLLEPAAIFAAASLGARALFELAAPGQRDLLPRVIVDTLVKMLLFAAGVWWLSADRRARWWPLLAAAPGDAALPGGQDPRARDPLGLRAAGPRLLAVGVVAGAAAFLFTALFSAPLAARTAIDAGGVWETQPGLVELTRGLGTGRWLVMLFSAVVVAPLFEEFLFRGVLHAALSWRLGAWPAALLSGGAFAFIHGWPQAAPVWPLGVLLGILYDRTGSLWCVVAAHVAFNAAMVALANLV